MLGASPLLASRLPRTKQTERSDTITKPILADQTGPDLTRPLRDSLLILLDISHRMECTRATQALIGLCKSELMASQKPGCLFVHVRPRVGDGSNDLQS